MTKREICERILEILVRRGGYEDHLDIYKDLRDLILELAEPDDELLHLDDEPNPTYAFKDVLRRYLKEHGDMNTVCDQCRMAPFCDSSVHEVCLNLQKDVENGR